MPAATATLMDILQRTDVWRGDRLAALDGQAQASGLDTLDAQLPGGGWPRGALVELLSATRAIGEISLLLPALRAVVDEAPIAIVAPPACAHAPAWAAHFPLAQLLWVTAADEDIAWSTEQLLGSGALGAVLAWLPARVDNKTLRRLQLAAEGCRSLAFMFRDESCARVASPAPLRLALVGSPDGLRVDILKRRGPPCARSLLLQVERPLPWQRVLRRSVPPVGHTVLRGVPSSVKASQPAKVAP